MYFPRAVCCLSVSVNLSAEGLLFGKLMCICARTWIMEEVGDHLKTCHCSRGSAVPPVFCSLYRTLLRAGTSASVADNMLIHVRKSEFDYLFYLVTYSTHDNFPIKKVTNTV